MEEWVKHNVTAILRAKTFFACWWSWKLRDDFVWILHQDNAPSSKVIIVQIIFAPKLKVYHSPSIVLAWYGPLLLFLFAKLKSPFQERCFEFIEVIRKFPEEVGDYTSILLKMYGGSDETQWHFYIYKAYFEGEIF